MRLEILLPFEVFIDEPEVSRIVAETSAGSFGLLRQRLDCVAALVPGILSYETRARGEAFLAIDEGVLVKTGAWVRVSVRRAIRGASLAQLHATVARDFLVRDAQAQALRSTMANIEGGLLRSFARFQNG